MASTKELNTKLTFRPLTVDDIESIIRIDEQILRRKRSQLFQHQLREQIEKHGEESLCAVSSDGKLVGYLIAETKVYIYGTDDLSAWIILLGVDPNYQKKGIGKQLINEYMDHLKEVGVKKITTLIDWNYSRMIHFFSANKFSPSKTINLERVL